MVEPVEPVKSETKEEEKEVKGKNTNIKEKFIFTGKSLYMIPKDSKCRRWLADLISQPYFESFIYHLIGMNSILLMIDEPILENLYSKKTIATMQDVISLIFIIEACLKIFVMGFVVGKHTYLRDSFNILDIIIVVFSIVSFFLDVFETSNDLSYIRAFRALRALRPLKLVSKNEGMKMIVNSLLSSIKQLVNVMLIAFLFFFVFGIMGIQFLSGKVSYCSQLDFHNKFDCQQAGLTWELPPNNYNNIFYSMLTFLCISTLEMWPDMMFDAIDSGTEINDGPVF